MKHSLLMLAGCVLPLLLLLLLPFFGLGQGETLVIAMVLMFAAHLLMTGGHGTGGCHAGHRRDHRANENNHSRQEAYHEHAEH